MNSLHGIIPIKKEAGMTSHDVVYRIRQISGVKKVGHTGTLDPDATGLLLVAIGHATRISEYLTEESKIYRAECILGSSTTTEDATGEIIEQVKVTKLDLEQVHEVLASFIGDYKQIPPMYSAIKVGGQPLYKLARKGEEHVRPARLVHIYDIKLNNYIVEQGQAMLDFTVSCSKGTYIRTLSVDIGKALGLPAHMSYLERIASGSFHVNNAYSLAEVKERFDAGEATDIMVSMNDALSKFPAVTVNDEDVKNVIYNGRQLLLESITDEIASQQPIKILNKNDQLVAIYQLTVANKFMPVKVFKYGEVNENNRN